MRRIESALVLVVAATALSLSACKPKYPACESDDHCAEKSEVCVQGQCQECKDDAGCDAKHGAGHECVRGRCEVKPECRADADCAATGAGLVCRSAKCVPECKETTDCPTGTKCDSQKCVPECANDLECGPGRTCDGGACKSDTRDTNKISAACRPMSGGSSSEIVSLQTVYFDFNEFNLTVDTRKALDQAADCIKQAGATLTIILEGHGDERGTQEYNLALGEKRASAVRSYLKNLGLDAARVDTRSFGENKPLCNEATEDCWQKNRRVEFVQKLRTN